MTDFSIFDEPDAAVAALNADPSFVEQKHRKATRQRGGLHSVASRASWGMFGMSLTDLNTEAKKHSPGRAHVKAAHDALRIVAGYDPDHASSANGLGFSKSDVTLGHALATASIDVIHMSDAYAALVHQLAARYRKQVPPHLALKMGFTDQHDLFD